MFGDQIVNAAIIGELATVVVAECINRCMNSLKRIQYAPESMVKEVRQYSDWAMCKRIST
jgi:hypothetical protein